MKEKFFKPSRDIAGRMLDTEMIVMAVKDSRVFSLNGTASLIWSAADGATPLSEIVKSKLMSEFEVDFETAYLDALALVEELAQEGILLLADHPIGPEGA